MTSIAHVGLDVHKEETRVVLLPQDSREPLDECALPTTAHHLCRYLRRWGEQYELHCYYEAGPLGYVPYRWLRGLGVECQVIAPSKTPRAPGDRVKTDRRDARLLARQGRAGALVRVWVPTPEQERVRSVVRYREATVRDVVAAKQRVLKFGALRGMVWEGGASHWTQAHMEWLRKLEFEGVDAWTAQQMLGELQHRLNQLAEVERQVAELARQDPWRDPVGRVACFKGLDIVSSMAVVTETMDFHRFPSAAQYMSYWGMVCGEHSSGTSQRRGSITKCGSAHARRVWVEAAWHYRHAPKVGAKLSRRQQGQPAEVVAHAWKAQQRLHKKFWRIALVKSKPIAAVAVARELAGFVWGAMTQ